MRPAWIVAAALALSCVPASEELPPTGAAGFGTQPTAATRGEPFTTDDGWVVRIDKLALSVFVSTSPGTGSYDGRRYGSGGWIIDARRPTVVYAPEVSPGGAIVSAQLRGSYLYIGRDNPRDRRRVVGVAEEDVDRFNRPPDEGFDDYYGSLYDKFPAGDGPSILLSARAERGGRVVRVEFALGVQAYGGGSSSRYIANVQEDTVVAGRLDIRAEELFRDGKGNLVFGEIATADANGDGVVTGAELLASPTTCKCPVTAPAHPSGSVPPPSLVDLIELNAAKLLVPR